MQFKQLEAFAKVTELRSFSRAAEELYLTQPTVSAHVKALEEEIGCQLVSRSTRSLSLTEEGNTFYPYVRRILDLKNTALQKLRQEQRQILRIGASTIPSGYILPRLLKEYRKLHPDIYFNVVQGNSGTIEEMIGDNTLDIGFVGMDSTEKNILSYPFCEDSLLYVAPATEYYRRLFDRSPSLQELLQEPLILREANSGTLHALDSYLLEQHVDMSKLNIIGNVNDLEAIKQMILNQTGVSILSGFSVSDLLARGQLLAYPLHTPHPRRFYIIQKKDKSLSPTEESFLGFSRSFYTL